MKNKILYLLIGLALILGLFFTRPRGLDNETKALIDEANSLNTSEIFPGFDSSAYPNDVNYGNIEYRYYRGQITEQKPEYPKALSAVLTENGPVTKVMPLKDFRNFYDLGNRSKDDLEKAFISVLIHEAFHCHQMDNGFDYELDGNNRIETDSSRINESQEPEAILAVLDDDENYKKLWLEEMDGLIAYRDRNDDTGYRKALESKDKYLQNKFDEEDYETFARYTKEMEVLEGTARFVENKVLAHYGMEENGSYHGLYSPGPSQFYISGAIKTEILEKQSRLGDIKFDFSVSLDELLQI